MGLRGVLGWFAGDIAIDLGTASTVVYVRGQGIVLREPSVVALEQQTNSILAVGGEAKRMVGRTPGNVVSVCPIKESVIADFSMTETLLRHCIDKALGRRAFACARCVIGVPSHSTEVEQRAVREAAMNAGAREVYLLDGPLAAAVGVGLPIAEPSSNMIVDVGGGTTDIAVISLGGVVSGESVKVAGDRMDGAIANYMKRHYNLLIGESMAETVKLEVGSAYPLDERKTMAVKGRDMISGIPRTVAVHDAEIRGAMDEPVHAILNALRTALEDVPPDLAGDIIDRGVVMTGGGSLLPGLAARFQEETNLCIMTADAPLSSVALGLGTVLDEPERFRTVFQLSSQ